MSKKNYTPDMEESVMTDINERFVGDVINEEKLKKLNGIRELCRKIAERDHDIKYTARPFSNRNQNGMVILDFPSVVFCTDDGVMKRLSDAFYAAESVAFSTLGGNLRITFGVRDMWNEYHYEDEK